MGNERKHRHQHRVAPLCAFGQPFARVTFDVSAVREATGYAVMVTRDVESADMPETLERTRALFPAREGYVTRIEVSAGGDGGNAA